MQTGIEDYVIAISRQAILFDVLEFAGSRRDVDRLSALFLGPHGGIVRQSGGSTGQKHVAGFGDLFADIVSQMAAFFHARAFGGTGNTNLVAHFFNFSGVIISLSNCFSICSSRVFWPM